MKTPPFPVNEESRLAVLKAKNLLYSPAEEKFDRITRLAKRLFAVPIALISLVGDEKQWFKSCQGLIAAETPRDISFCGHAILGNDVFIVPDTLDYPDFRDNPLVTGEPHIRFYAGNPLFCEGYKIGTLCIIDKQPRSFPPSEIDILRSLTAWIENEIRMISLGEQQTALLERYNELERQSMIDPITGAWNLNGINELLESELSRAYDSSMDLTIMLISLDGLENELIETTEQNKAEILKALAQRIRSSLRAHDILGYCGANEFMVILADTDKDFSMNLPKIIMLSATIEALDTSAGSSTVMLSIGVLPFSKPKHSHITRETIYMDVQQALEKARAEGPNQIHYNNDHKKRVPVQKSDR